ncbi:uncharacterized protein LOC113002869 [Solenopsis invicta]|uniref:uncharacterized protein LOC113002869 n=1 Tax=Solenopsis invicta TaxID=13686 RepID=UPI00193E466C|nr:uncharacterized protein LOC113002869 [Solenopsis invicta]
MVSGGQSASCERNTDRESSYPHYSTVLNLKGIEFPMTLPQIKKFEILNKISINLYCIEEKKLSIFPIRLTERKMDKHINLLYVQDDNVGHFALIKNMSRLMSSQLSKKKNKKFFCDRCLHYFSSNDKLEIYTMDCGKINDCAIILPSEDDKWLSFKNYCRKERMPFIVYANLECILEKTEDEKNYQHHRVFSIAYYVHCAYDNSLSMYRFHSDKNCIAWFVEQLKDLAQIVNNILSVNVSMDLTQDDWKKFNNATHCHICKKSFTNEIERPLPYKDFRWVDDVTNFNFMDIALDSPTGYILEIDLEYPQHLHDAHIDLPFCPVRDKPPGKRQDKLLATLYDKKRYVIHYRNLQ